MKLNAHKIAPIEAATKESAIDDFNHDHGQNIESIERKYFYTATALGKPVQAGINPQKKGVYISCNLVSFPTDSELIHLSGREFPTYEEAENLLFSLGFKKY